jgi:hypothetical protein
VKNRLIIIVLCLAFVKVNSQSLPYFSNKIMIKVSENYRSQCLDNDIQVDELQQVLKDKNVTIQRIFPTHNTLN